MSKPWFLLGNRVWEGSREDELSERGLEACLGFITIREGRKDIPGRGEVRAACKRRLQGRAAQKPSRDLEGVGSMGLQGPACGWWEGRLERQAGAGSWRTGFGC